MGDREEAGKGWEFLYSQNSISRRWGGREWYPTQKCQPMIDFELEFNLTAGTYRCILFACFRYIRYPFVIIYTLSISPDRTPLDPSHCAGTPLKTPRRERHEPWTRLAHRPLLWAVEPWLHIGLTPTPQSCAAPACLLLPSRCIWGPSFDCNTPDCFRSLAASARKQTQNI
jgi:hypothetical protein